MQKVVLGTVLLLFLVTLVSVIESIITSYETKKEPALIARPSPAQAITTQAEKKHVSIEEKKRRFIRTILPSVQNVKGALCRGNAMARADDGTL